jgi:lipopolysaccharide transport system permease protein
MNPHQTHSISPRALVASLTGNAQLAAQMVRREVVGRYRGSFMGMAWSFFNPILMLCIYTFVFTVVFKAKWGIDASGGRANFAILMFAGLIVYGVFAECVNRAPALILSNVNYVKKIVFPLEVLPWVAFGSALFHSLISTVVLLVAQLLVFHTIPWTVVIFPLILLPLAFITIGISWFLASLGVYLRDVSHVILVLTSVLLYVSPIFYPISAVPVKYRGIISLNPLTSLIEDARDTLIYGKIPDFGSWALMMAIGMIVLYIGFVWFQKTRKGFADVL